MHASFRFRAPWMLALPLVIGASIAADPAAAASWECSAKNLVNYRYTGGNSAMIHLSPYPSGGTYRVTRVSDVKVTGKTKNGTVFTCVRK